jgi:hypothetical protein
MPTNLTGNTVSSTYDQLLHVDGGPTATEKTVYGGTGVATALKVSTGAVSVDNIKLDGNTVSSTNTNGDIVLSPNGTGTVSFSKAAITGGTITGVGLSGLSADLPIADGGTGASTASAARTNLGVGTNGTFDAAFGQFESTVDQTAVANTATVITFSASSAFNAGITLTSSTQLVCAAAGIYEIVLSLQFANSDSTNHTASFHFRKNGTDIANSAFIVVVPKAADGGVTFAEATVLDQLTAGQYFECVFAVSNAAVTLDTTAASGASPVRPAIPSAIATVKRIG